MTNSKKSAAASTSRARELLDALGVLVSPRSSPDAKAGALEKLTAHFDELCEQETKAAPRTAFSASAVAGLQGQLARLNKRIGTVAMASSTAKIDAMKHRAEKLAAAKAHRDPTIEMIERAARNTRGGR